MAVVAARPLALRRSSAVEVPSGRSSPWIPSKRPESSKTLTPSNRPESSKTPIPSRRPESSRTKRPESSKTPVASKRQESSKPPKPKTITRRNSEINSDKLSISPSGRISSLKTLKPNNPRPLDLHPRWNSSTKVDFDPKGSLRLQPNPHLPTILETKQLKQNISSTEAKRGRNPALLSGSKPLTQTPKLAPTLPSKEMSSSQKPSKLNTPRRNPPKPTNHLGTPNLTDIPPVEVCDSPEIVKATLAAPTMACFASGHLIDRVQDGRKCRPRGLLTVGRPVPEVIEEAEGLPPLIKASILWFSSPSGTSSSSINNISQSRIRTVLFRDDDSVKPPLVEERGCPSPVSETPKSPSTGCRFPTEGSNTSPFTMILKRAAAGHWGFLSPSPVMRQKVDDMADKEAKLKEELIMERKEETGPRASQGDVADCKKRN